MTIDLVQEHNLISGSFVLSFGGYDTSDIDHDATGGTVASALQALPSIQSVDVERSNPDFQVRVCVYACMFACMHACVDVCACVCMFVYVCMCMCMCESGR